MDQNAKQQIIDRLKDANNVLVTVSANPSVDQLAACIGFTLFLNKLGKHATAVFSGEVPSTIEFLKPEETIETDTNSLRDFIIALDKSKADKLRYKVEDQMVRIFITPYRTSLTEKDLEFSQGDFNVDAVVGLGVKEREDLDQAIMAHGRILHDATVISVNNHDQGNLGTINWVDLTASSLSEMLVDLSDGMGKGKLDGQMATAFLTGIVAQTDRFSNDKTSPQTMSIAAELMQAGANQQLIATELESTTVNEAATTDKKGKGKEAAEADEPEDTTAKDGSLRISHQADVDEEAPGDELPPVDEKSSSGGSSKHTLEPLDLPEPEAAPAPKPEPAHPTIMPTPLGATPSSPASDIELPPTPASSFAPIGKAEDRTPTQNEDPTRLSDISVTEASKTGKMSANTEPEHLQAEPSTDPLSMPMPTGQPTLNKSPVTFSSPSTPPTPPPTPTPPAPATPPNPTPVSPDFDLLKMDTTEQDPAVPHLDMPTPDLSVPANPAVGGESLEEARKEVDAAIKTSPNQALEPLAAMGSHPVNLDLSHGSAPEAPAPADPTMPPSFGQPAAPSMPFTMPQPSAAPGVNPNLPPSLVPPSAPVDTTGSNGSPTSPPPVPPPLLPPTPTP